MTHNDFTQSIYVEEFPSLAHSESRGADIISSINLNPSRSPISSVFGSHQPELISECVARGKENKMKLTLSPPDGNRLGCKLGTIVWEQDSAANNGV